MIDIERRTLLRAAGVAAVGGLVGGCGARDDAAALTPLQVKVARMSAGPASSAGPRVTGLGVSLLLAAYDATTDAVLSPYSIYSALAMTAAGARGETSAQFARLLGGSATAAAGSVSAVDAAVAKAVAAAAAADDKAVVDVANSVVVQRNFDVRPEFLTALAQGFGAGAQEADFEHAPAAALEAINGWVGRKTHGLIPELLGPGAVSEATRVVLLNALYLKAQWETPFTAPAGAAHFVTATGETASTPMMTAMVATATAAGPDWKSVQLPYSGGGLAMTIVLPAPGAFAAVRARLAQVLSQATGASKPGRVSVTMPPFSVDLSKGLKAALQAVGLRSVFEPSSADLSGIAGSPGDLHVSFVQHQAVVKVDRHGTEAAAATAVGKEATSAPQSVAFVVDRAFFFVIHDTTTRSPLFLGQVSRPKV